MGNIDNFEFGGMNTPLKEREKEETEINTIQMQRHEITRLKALLVRIENRCTSIDFDCHEADKVMCHSQWIRHEIAKVYPKFSRRERGENA